MTTKYPFPLTIAYLAMGAKSALLQHIERTGKPPEINGGELDFIDQVISRAEWLDRVAKELGAEDGELSCVWEYEVTEPYGEALATHLLYKDQCEETRPWFHVATLATLLKGECFGQQIENACAKVDAAMKLADDVRKSVRDVIQHTDFISKSVSPVEVVGEFKPTSKDEAHAHAQAAIARDMVQGEAIVMRPLITDTQILYMARFGRVLAKATGDVHGAADMTQIEALLS